MSSNKPVQQLNHSGNRSTWGTAWMPRENSQSMDVNAVSMQTTNNYPYNAHTRRAPHVYSCEQPNQWPIVFSGVLNHPLTVTPDSRWVWQRLPTSASNMNPSVTHRGLTSQTHLSPHSNVVSSHMSICNGPFFSTQSMEDLRSMELKVLVIGIRRRFEEVRFLHSPTNQPRGDPVSAERNVAALFEEIIDLQQLVRKFLSKDQRVWNCPHLPGQCPIIGHGFLPGSLNAGSSSPAPEGHINQPPRAYSAPPFTYLAPLPPYNGFMPEQSPCAFPQANFPIAQSYEYSSSPSYPLLLQPHQQVQFLTPVIFANPPSPTNVVDSFSTNGVDSEYHPPSPPVSPGEPYFVDSFSTNGVDTGSYPPLPPPLPLESGENFSCKDGLRQWSLRGPPYLAETVKLSTIYETVGEDPSVVLNFAHDYIRFIEISPTQQVGPTCGLLALSLIGNLHRRMTVEKEILPLALALGVTYQGEMFNAHEMACLARELLGDFCEVGWMPGNPLQEQADTIFYMLQHHTVLLVPYDNDVNNSPGMFQGRKAHWCAVVGSAQYKGHRFFCATHGKSETLAFWREDVLARSNNQLFDAKQSLGLHHECYKIGNLESELNGQIVTLTFTPGNPLRTVYCPDTDTMVEYFENIIKHLPPQLEY